MTWNAAGTIRLGDEEHPVEYELQVIKLPDRRREAQDSLTVTDPGILLRAMQGPCALVLPDGDELPIMIVKSYGLSGDFVSEGNL